jgi:hypothetical protein
VTEEEVEVETVSTGSFSETEMGAKPMGSARPGPIALPGPHFFPNGE